MGLSVEEVRGHVETDISDVSVRRLIDDAESEINRRYGSTAARTADLEGGHPIVFLKQRAASIASVTERVGDTTTTLSANDYRSRFDGMALERRNDGTNPACVWSGVVTVTYAPEAIGATRERVAIDLIKLALRYSGVKSEQVGDHGENTFGQEYDKERERILAGMRTNTRTFA
jgi:hypothetical protein